MNHGVDGYRKGCRCDECKSAKRNSARKYKLSLQNLPLDDPRHGKISTAKAGCKCEKCLQAIVDYKLRNLNSLSAHGTLNGYGYGCRCVDCRKAQADHMQAYYLSTLEASRNRVKVKEQRRRAKKTGLDCGCVTRKRLEDLFIIECGLCAYCGLPGSSMDHIIPISRGGPHCISNLRWACQKCNSSKGAKELIEFTNKKIQPIMFCYLT